MRILFAITLGEIGGAQEHVRILIEGLVQKGHDVGILVRDPSELADRARASQAQVLPWPHIVRDPHPSADLHARREMKGAVSAFRPDVLHLHSAKAGVLGRRILTSPTGITVYTCHHPAFGPGRKLSHRLLARPIEQLTLRYVDGIISVGRRDIPMLERIAGGVKVVHIRNSVPTSGPPLSPVLPIPNALWVARMKHPKDPLQAVAVWEEVVREIPKARLDLCGDGPLASRLRDRIADSPARQAITYHGRVEELAPFQAQASLFLLTTAVEGGITMATLEAMAEGLVPIVSDAGDASSLVDLGAGVVLPDRSVTASAQKIVALLRDPDRMTRMRSAALRLVREDWTADDMVQATETAYQEFLHRARVTPGG